MSEMFQQFQQPKIDQGTKEDSNVVLYHGSTYRTGHPTNSMMMRYIF